MKLANILDSKSSAERLEGSSPSSGTSLFLENLAYITGVAIGDGNLSNPNGRCIRLRISCDIKYPKIIEEICKALKIILPQNKVSKINRKCNCVDISSYSNAWGKWLDWKFNKGPKYKQNIKVPKWIKNNPLYSKYFLKGLFQTDGCIYYDRKYLMVNIVTTIPGLSKEIKELIQKIGFLPRENTLLPRDKMRQIKYTIRISKNSDEFIRSLDLYKE